MKQLIISILLFVASGFQIKAQEAARSIDTKAMVVMDNLRSHAGVGKVVAALERQTVPGKEAPKVLRWVHVAISNAKALLKECIME